MTESRHIAIVDYGAGNIQSVRNALDLFGASYHLAKQPADLDDAAKILLPGVGHFGQMLNSLRATGMAERIGTEAERGTPLLGICLGMQALFESSEEAPGLEGLSLIQGRIERFRGVSRVPHMGWNDVAIDGGMSTTFYFANSFYAPVGPWTAGWSEYEGIEFSAMVRRGNVSGFQFHPEKSGSAGLALLKEWCETC